MKQYLNVVFLQESQAEEAMGILYSKGEQAALEYLAQWDNGDGEINWKSQAGLRDRVVKSGPYIMSYNERLPYIGLEREVETV